jgi:hypothetical protein
MFRQAFAERRGRPKEKNRGTNSFGGVKAPSPPLRNVAKQSPKSPIAPVSEWGATGSSIGKRRLLTSAQFAEMRRKLADVDAKLRQLGAAERARRR